ncbi:bifunctional adenosylcobinamide kinase/adenosylcobinamide-phosphate guanylyltransferase [Alkalimarinus alittae]|uniref:Bifunctional adenosylcobalamin biosynthesis protein n=1 Tax=Alkalimarinus alittae TaxID=2961619 RepID=A0ABY6N1T1_9ALTE|nr:bifunctional adenosylcobinamide kinase/adenosylcobinamide-phosphate guanylyltransferase [Alkalimarinus alittae]UZE95959.1 bifunctional adenosylcobinamide kinase/adenosylcobinamide-phosphate guanylyltransferase [Alkalimarinus alittae]
MRELILGGARSGKSHLAEQRAASSQQDVLYIATAQAYDDEMKARITRHQSDRSTHWTTVEEPHYLASVLQQHAKEERVILVDCLTLWMSNLLCMDDEPFFKQQKEHFLQCFKALPGHVILVSNEVGQGVIPDNALARRFVDETGWLHQALAAQSDRVTFVTAGIAQQLKP